MSESTAIQPFDFHGITVRATVIDGDPWLVATDVAAALTLQHTGSALRMVDEEDRRTIRRSEGVLFPQGFGPQVNDVTVINESGVYAMIFQSNKPKAREFRRWVTSEVLPAIRKTGAYITPAAALDPLDALQAMITQLRDQRDRLDSHERAIDGHGHALLELGARTERLEAGYERYTATGYANLRGLRHDVTYLNRLGRVAAPIARRGGVPFEKAHSTIFGTVNAWPLDVWDEALAALSRAES